MADKRKLIIKQRIKTISFIAETRRAAENIWMFLCSFSKYYSPAYLTIWKGWLNYGVKMSPWGNVCTTHNVDAVSFMPQPASGLPINTQWYMQHGATQHITNIKLDLFPDTCGPSMISGQYTDYHAHGRIWPPNSDFFLWQFMKKTVSQMEISSMLLTAMVSSCVEWLWRTCHHMVMNIHNYFLEAVQQNSNCAEYVLC